jgi:hypothetical protein
VSKYWRERLDPELHRDYMGGGEAAQDAGGWPVNPAKTDGWIYFVRECSFTFTFVNLAQLEEAQRFLERKVHPARRRPGITLEHYWQRWYERLPPGLCGGSKRLKILRALAEAKREFGCHVAMDVSAPFRGARETSGGAG